MTSAFESEGLAQDASPRAASTPELLARQRAETLADEADQLVAKLVEGGPLGRIVAEHFEARGSRFRARLALSACHALGVAEAQAVPWAATCEMLHNASLIHDDVQDRDAERRGAQAVWASHGAAQAINAGDLLLVLPCRVVDQVPAPDAMRWALLRAAMERAEQTVRGQALEMSLLATEAFDWPTYRRAARGKTGGLIALPIEGAALLAGHHPASARALGDCLCELGLLYQVRDDIRDLWGDKGREPGSDLVQGRVTAVVVEHIAQHPAERDWLRGLLQRDDPSLSASDRREIVERLERMGTLAALNQRQQSLAQRFAEQFDALGEGALRPLVEQTLAAISPTLDPAQPALERS